jgi:toxin-antitoxin system PIN domain toxin
MTLFFPDVNVWLALSIADHVHSEDAWRWLKLLRPDAKLTLCRYTQLGILRLLTNSSVTGTPALTLRKAWDVYDRWMDDPRVEFYPEPRDIDADFRKATRHLAAQSAPKSIRDCWLLAFASGIEATLVTFDRSLCDLAQKQGHPAVIPA